MAQRPKKTTQQINKFSAKVSSISGPHNLKVILADHVHLHVKHGQDFQEILDLVILDALQDRGKE